MPEEEKTNPAIDAGVHKTVQTYAEDIAKTIEGDKGGGGLIKKIIHEDEEHQIEKINQSPESRKNKILLVAGSILILVALATLLYFIFNKNISTVPAQVQFVPLIFNDKSSFIEVKDLKKDEIAQTVLNKVDTTDVKPGGIEGIYLTVDKRTVGLHEFIGLISGNFVPGNNFISNNFLLGAVNEGTKPASSSGKDFFILLKMRSVPDIFDSLRLWEGKMFVDLQGFFGISTSPLTKNLPTKSFEDGIIENRNARILYDNDRKIVMMYIFADDTSVIITDTDAAAREIMLRLSAGEIKK
jgi:hypothetical protein